jgi:hypothetical protein
MENSMPKSNGPVPIDNRLDKRVEQYLKIRKKINEVELGLEKLTQCKQRLDGELQAFLDENKLKSVRTTGGVLVTSYVKPSAKLEDPEAFMNFVMKNGAYELLDRRANATACRDHAEEHDGKLPPGVVINNRRIIGVTEP